MEVIEEQKALKDARDESVAAKNAAISAQARIETEKLEAKLKRNVMRQIVK